MNLRADAVKDITGSGDLLRSLMNNIPGIVYRGMPDWSITFVGGEVERLTGYTCREMLGESTLWRILIHPDDIDPVCESIRNAVCRQEGILRVECRIVRKDGEVRWVSDRRQMIYDEGGMLLYVDGLCMDITREVFLRKQAQAAQRMEAVGTLAGGIAHDFNNALTGIIGFADLLRMRLEKEPKLQGDVDEILKCAERASTLTRQLLAFARRQVIEPMSLGLNTVVRDLTRLMKKVSGEQIEVRTRLTGGIPHIFADRGQLEQVLLNLCLNSRDAMPAGGEFLVSTDAVAWEGERLQDQAIMPAGQYVLLSVADNGSGMDDATRKRAFEPYFTKKASG
ncbi:two-component system sensor histidine kinase NtrB, partial [Candidatus Deferrimicrobium sp.]|uniref:two-component system sensor histidine kinase NtrB n=1 Tax=Candidatus Deferrimicrobium sp. TaxID=3060586 RepID=UPI003C431177